MSKQRPLLKKDEATQQLTDLIDVAKEALETGKPIDYSLNLTAVTSKRGATPEEAIKAMEAFRTYLGQAANDWQFNPIVMVQTPYEDVAGAAMQKSFASKIETRLKLEKSLGEVADKVKTEINSAVTKL